jgi:hypothetical protein
MWTKMPHFHEICTLPVFCTQVYVVYSGLHPIVQNQTKFKSPQNMIAHKGLQFQGFLIIPFREKKREFQVLTLVLSLVSLHPCFQMNDAHYSI